MNLSDYGYSIDFNYIKADYVGFFDIFAVQPKNLEHFRTYFQYNIPPPGNVFFRWKMVIVCFRKHGHIIFEDYRVRFNDDLDNSAREIYEAYLKMHNYELHN